MDIIVVAEQMAGAPLAELERRYQVVHLPHLWEDAEALCKQVKNASALLVRNQTQVDARVFASAPKLRVIGRAGVGLDNVDLAAATAAGVVVSYSPGANANAVAELTCGYMIALSRHLTAAHQHVRQGGWKRLDYLGQEIAGRTLAVVGCGAIGRLTATKAIALGMNVVGYDPFMSPLHPQIAGLGLELGPLDEVIARADFVSCHVPSSPQTLGLFNAKRFALMRRGAIFINTSRGNVVDEEALCSALVQGHLAGAALDVRALEPPKAGALETLRNVILTPHIGGLTREAQEAVMHMICNDVSCVLEGKAAVNFANFATPQAGR